MNFIRNNNLTAIAVNNLNNVKISGINFNNYSTAIKFNNSNNSKVSNNNITNTITSSDSNGLIFNNSQKSVKTSMEKTGTPIAIIALSVLSIVRLTLKRKKQE